MSNILTTVQSVNASSTVKPMASCNAGLLLISQALPFRSHWTARVHAGPCVRHTERSWVTHVGHGSCPVPWQQRLLVHKQVVQIGDKPKLLHQKQTLQVARATGGGTPDREKEERLQLCARQRPCERCEMAHQLSRLSVAPSHVLRRKLPAAWSQQQKQ